MRRSQTRVDPLAELQTEGAGPSTSPLDGETLVSLPFVEGISSGRTSWLSLFDSISSFPLFMSNRFTSIPLSSYDQCPPQLSAIRYIYLDFFVPILINSSSLQLPLHPFQYFHLRRTSRPHHWVITPTCRLYVLSSRSHPPSTTTISSSCLQDRIPTHLLTPSLCRRRGLAAT